MIYFVMIDERVSAARYDEMEGCSIDLVAHLFSVLREVRHKLNHYAGWKVDRDAVSDDMFVFGETDTVPRRHRFGREDGCIRYLVACRGVA
jgi:hypothetical protein